MGLEHGSAEIEQVWVKTNRGGEKSQLEPGRGRQKPGMLGTINVAMTNKFGRRERRSR